MSEPAVAAMVMGYVVADGSVLGGKCRGSVFAARGCPDHLRTAPGPVLSPRFNQDMSLSMGFLPASASSISLGRLV